MPATKQIDAMTAATALGGTEEIPGVQSAANVKITAAQIKTFTSASPTLVTPVLGVAAGTSLALGGATIGSNALAVTGSVAISSTVSVGSGVVATGFYAGSLSNALRLTSTANGEGFFANAAGSVGFTLSAPSGTATLQHGALDAASPVAQTIKFQDVATGTSNTAGVNATIRAPAGTGTGAGGSLIFQVAPAGSSGTAKNAWVTALTIGYDKNIDFAGNITMPAANSLNWSARGLIDMTGAGVFRFRNNSATQDFTITTGAANLATFNGGITLGGPLKVSNAYVATPQVPTGYITIYDSTGTAYKVSVNV